MKTIIDPLSRRYKGTPKIKGSICYGIAKWLNNIQKKKTNKKGGMELAP